MINSSPGEPGVIVWLTGLSGAGKSTIASAVADELSRRDVPVQILDGDIVRLNLSKGLGFSREDRDENVRRVGFVADLLRRHGVIVLVALVSPYRTARDAVRDAVRESRGLFVEVFVNAPVDECERRDPKGLYGRARRGELPNFTGISDPYEDPIAAEVECRTDLESLEESARKVLDAIDRARRGSGRDGGGAGHSRSGSAATV